MAKTPFNADRGHGTLLLDPEEVLLVEDKNDPRYDPRIDRPLTEEFLESLKGGQLQPGIVCKHPESGKPMVVDGRRRLRGYRELNKRAKPGEPHYKWAATYRRIDTDAQFTQARLEANLHEGDSIVEKARTADQLVTRYGWTVERIGVCLGITQSTVRKYLALLECAAPVLAAVEDKRIGVNAAAELASLPKPEQLAQLAKIQEGTAAPEREKKPSKKKITKHGRPSASMIRALADVVSKKTDDRQVHPHAKAILGWVTGTITTKALVKAVPDIGFSVDEAGV